MTDKFLIKRVPNTKNADRYITMSLRIERELQERYGELANQSEFSRNKLMCMALRYALDHLEFIDSDPSPDLEPK